MHIVTLGKERLFKKMGGPLGGAIFDKNGQDWYQNNQ